MTSPVRAPVEVQFRATGTEQVRAGLKLVRAEAEGLGHSTMIGLGELARGLGSVAQAGQATAFGMKEITNSAMRLGSALGPGAGLIGIVTLLGGVIVEHFTKARDEMKKTSETFQTEVGKMANAADAAGLTGKARDVYFGTPYNDKGQLQNPSAVRGAFQGSLADLRSRMAMLQGKLLPGGTFVNDVANIPIQAAIRKLQPDLDKAEASFRKIRDAIESIQSRPASMGIMGMTTTAKSDAALSREGDEAERYLAKHPIDEILNRATLEGMGVQTTRGLIASLGAQNIFAGKTGVEGPAKKPEKTTGDKVGEEFIKTVIEPMATTIQHGITETIGGALSAGFDAAFAKGANIGKVAAAFGGAALQTIGGVFKQIGMETLVGLSFMKTIKDSILAWAPELGLAAAIGLIAFGSALQSAGGRIGSSGSGGGGGGSSYSAPPTIIDRGSINPASVGSASSLSPRSPINVTIIGPNDPTVQRQFAEIARNADRRGGV